MFAFIEGVGNCDVGWLKPYRLVPMARKFAGPCPNAVHALELIGTPQ